MELVGHGSRDGLQLGSVVKDQVVLRQMLVCYESILTAESRALLFSESFTRRLLTGVRKKYPPRRNLTLAAKGCDEKRQGQIAEVKTVRGRPRLENRETRGSKIKAVPGLGSEGNRPECNNWGSRANPRAAKVSLMIRLPANFYFGRAACATY
jgi:hypothetical protein